MNRWLTDNSPPHPAAVHGPSRGGVATWLDGLRQHPLAALTLDGLAERWAHHPLHATARLAEAAAAASVAPLLRRHPVLVLAAATVAGALLMRARPWRWVLQPALLASVAAHLAAPSYTTARPAPMSPGQPGP